MSKIDSALTQMESIEAMAKEDRWMNNLHPSVKLLLTVFYIILTVSFSKYQLAGLLGMAVYPLAVFIIAEFSFKDALYRLRIVLPLVCLIGIANPFFDRQTVLYIGTVPVTGGGLSMLTLILKGIFAVLASYLLIITTSIEKICYALRRLHVPKFLVTEILLIYRYISVLLKETHRMVTAYHLRAPGQKGIAVHAWGSFAGQLLLRSMDRAERVYQSMCLRGFRGDFYIPGLEKPVKKDWFWLLIWAVLLTALRFLPVLELLGGIFI